jgi:hypothetical protein
MTRKIEYDHYRVVEGTKEIEKYVKDISFTSVTENRETPGKDGQRKYFLIIKYPKCRTIRKLLNSLAVSWANGAKYS